MEFYLKGKSSRFQSGDLVLLLVFMVSASSLYYYGQIPFMILLGSIVVAILVLLALAGRIAAPLYLEGNMVRNLLANGGALPRTIFEKHFENFSSYDTHLNRLLDRGIVDQNNETVSLINEKYQKGIQNRFMMWGDQEYKILGYNLRLHWIRAT